LVKLKYSGWIVGRVLISLFKDMSPYVVIPLLSVTHGQCDARPMVTLPACAGTKFILMLTEALVCEQLAQGCTQMCSGPESI